MPANSGRQPSAPLVDIKFRNGRTHRNTEPGKWRWKPWPSGEHDFDIVRWQVSKGE